MNKTLRYSLIVLLLISAACSTGKKALQNGDYYSAVIKSVERLRSNPDKAKAQSTLQQSYPLAVNWYQQEISTLLSSNDPFKYSKTVGHYQTLNKMTDEIRRCPGALHVIPYPKNYQTEEEMAKQNAAPECYAAGVLELAKGSRQAAVTAYLNFEKANLFVPNYKDVAEKMDEAEFLATLKVIIDHVPVNSTKYQLSAEFFQDQVTQYIFHNIKQRFVRFYTPKQAELEKLEYPDQVIGMRFEDFVVGETHDTNIEKEVVSADSVEVGSTKLKNGETIKVFNKVNAKLHIHKREVISKGILSLHIIEFDNKKEINNKQFGGQFNWFHQWGHYNGDERALNKEELNICNNEPILPPAHQDLFVEFTKPIFTDLTAELKRFYSRY
ncbi:hypothetical protein BZG02_06590 [Labilibaculum filiforme]|uniref:Lipoprotein n=1 Tax=Labilibaculum filiforme TaxID=1940526 RepID=A0A2N3I2D5_9BACT|nr:hypothetical protein [Labilibaculum filiforme]PKQ64469.1 hypothetical protein BZG02_06590 [Labilibaculum filiforme]